MLRPTILFALLATCATSAAAAMLSPEVPAALAIPEAGQTVLLRAAARGVQIYTCTATNGFTWTLTAPDATLFDDRKQALGRHSAGPTWTLSKDGSQVVGAVLAKAPAPDATAIPWLLLKATSHAGSGLFARVRYIQRVATTGGVAPAAGCDAKKVGTTVRIDYSASYYFWGPG